MVAVVDDTVVGHLVATRAHIGSSPAIGIGPVSVVPEMHGRGVGSALMHFALGAADAMGETVAGLLGDPAFYTRFGFAPAAAMDITGPDPSWGDYFQARAPLFVFRPAWRLSLCGAVLQALKPVVNS